MIRLVNLKKNLTTKWITNGVNLEIPDQKMTVIIGRSGEGKSVLLKQIIGLLNQLKVCHLLMVLIFPRTF